MSCPNQDTANASILSAAQGPLKVAGDAGSVEERSAGDLIQISNYLAGLCAMGNPNRGLRYTALLPGGGSYWPYANPTPRWSRW